MDDYKIAFINGDTDFNETKIDGSLEYVGEMSADSMHSKSLLEYANENYNNMPIFKKLNIRHQPEIISYFYTKMGKIVFLNTTPSTKELLSKYGKSGMLLLPNHLTEKQKESLIDFCKKIEKYNISVSYDLEIEDGMLTGKTYQSQENQKPEEIIRNYLNKMDKINSK